MLSYLDLITYFNFVATRQNVLGIRTYSLKQQQAETAHDFSTSKRKNYFFRFTVRHFWSFMYAVFSTLRPNAHKDSLAVTRELFRIYGFFFFQLWSMLCVVNLWKWKQWNSFKVRTSNEGSTIFCIEANLFHSPPNKFFTHWCWCFVWSSLTLCYL